MAGRAAWLGVLAAALLGCERPAATPQRHGYHPGRERRKISNGEVVGGAVLELSEKALRFIEAEGFAVAERDLTAGRFATAWRPQRLDVAVADCGALDAKPVLHDPARVEARSRLRWRAEPAQGEGRVQVLFVLELDVRPAKGADARLPDPLVCYSRGKIERDLVKKLLWRL